MNKQERLNYILGEIGWLDALLSDIRSLIKGGQRYKNKHSRTLGGTYGAGNISIPMLICTGLELAAALYTGRTEYNMGRSNYKAPENVQKFIEEYFPAHTKKIPRILWDAIRNGTHHLFIPKSIKYSRNRVQFMFYVDNSTVPSHVTKVGNRIQIKINSIEFYRILKKALEDYKSEIKINATLQIRFIKAWKSIKPRVITSRNIMSPEVKYLSKTLQHTGSINLFSDLVA